MNLLKKIIASLFAITITAVIALSPQIVNEFISAGMQTTSPSWATALINFSWYAFLLTFVLPTTYFVTYAMLSRTSRRYGGNAPALSIPIAMVVFGVLVIYFSRSILTTLMTYVLIAVSIIALALVVKNNEKVYRPAPSILAYINDGELPLVSVVIPAYNEKKQ